MNEGMNIVVADIIRQDRSIVLCRKWTPDPRPPSKLQRFADEINVQIQEAGDMAPIRVRNNLDSAVPEPFEYATDYLAPIEFHKPLFSCMPGCPCSVNTGEGDSGWDCPCLVGSNVPYHLERSEDGVIVSRKLSERLGPEDPIYECNDGCTCVMTGSCQQRVSQARSQFRFELIRKSDNTGKYRWTVRTRDKIPAGSFVMRYTGELITKQEMEKRYPNPLNRPHRLMMLRYLPGMKDEHLCFVDSSQSGNISRFMNHSCDPNLVPRVLYSSNYSLYQPRIAFFAAKNIPADAELNFDYQMDRHTQDLPVSKQIRAENDLFCFDGNPELQFRKEEPAISESGIRMLLRHKSIPCHCKSLRCRGFLT